MPLLMHKLDLNIKEFEKFVQVKLNKENVFGNLTQQFNVSEAAI
jgi:hypothetical protein